MNPRTVVWRFCDGKAGHERQTAGLLQALEVLRPLDVFPVTQAKRLPSTRPALAVGAGSGCAWRLLPRPALRGALRVYLMRPPLPAWLFDLCLIPRHDGAVERAGVIITEGVLNDLVPAPGPRGGPLLVLVGGPSKHHRWDERALLHQVTAVLADAAGTPVVVADSRRTPGPTRAALQALAGPGVVVVRHEDVPASWLPTTLARAPAVWVSADSVSMLFEALTAGCKVGVLEVPALREDRISRIAHSLAERGLATTFAEWRRRGALLPPREPLAEATRCAALVDAALRARGV